MLWQDIHSALHNTSLFSALRDASTFVGSIVQKLIIATELNLPVKGLELLNALEFLNAHGHNPGSPPI